MHIVIIDILSLQICINGTLKVPDEIKTSTEGVLQIKDTAHILKDLTKGTILIEVQPSLK